MDKVKIGFPIEYECDDGVIRDGLFLREPEIKELEKRLKEINKITDLKQQVKKQKDMFDKIECIIKNKIQKLNRRIDNEIDMGSQGEQLIISICENEIRFLKDILKEVSE